MEQIVVKTEVQSNGDILLFYVDESQSGVEEIEKLEDLTQHEVVEFQESDFVFANVEDSVDDYCLRTTDNIEINEEWQEADVQKLLKFYVDNIQNLESGKTTIQRLWEVACRTIFHDKDPTLCEVCLLSLKQKYAEILTNYQKSGVLEDWPYSDLCHRAFQNDYYVKELINESIRGEASDNNSNLTEAFKTNEDGVLIINRPRTGRSLKHPVDKKVELMLNLYLKYKNAYHKNNLYKGIWHKIAMEMEDEDAEYWHRRFLNFKQHYIRMLHRRYEVGPNKINWPYMKIFDKIFEGDERFKNKYAGRPAGDNITREEEKNFNETERTVLVKYYFDCFHEFQDPTIPNKFLWHEIGRLLEKNPKQCKQKYKELKSEHFNRLMEGEYDIYNRIPTAIILDNIIAREIEMELANRQNIDEEFGPWSMGKIDELVQFFYDNIELFKDSVCYYVCWSMVAEKLKKNIHNCKKQWNKLTALYKSILEDKKENPDMQIDWKYIDTFDRIFDYGMDTNLLEGYENIKVQDESNVPEKIGVKRVHIDEDNIDNYSEDEEMYDERGFMKHCKRRGESKANKILDFYLRNKDKFSCSSQKKLSLWEVLAKQLGITAEQCAHRFRNLKQIYTSYVQREINKPDMPILWPYYPMCKKVFGYRAIKSKLKSGKSGFEEGEEWAAREIKQLINYFSNNYDSLHQNIEDHCRWSDLARVIGKTEAACSEKFLELRKSYRKLTTMKSRNPEIKVSWKYFNLMDEIFNTRTMNRKSNNEDGNIIMCDGEEMDIDNIKTELPEDDDFEYIIVIPEDQEPMESVDDATINEEIVDSNQIQESEEEKIESKQTNKWNKRTKKKLLILYLKYLRSHKGKEIDSREMWKEISSKLMKPAMTCRRILIKLKNQHRISASNEDFKLSSPYYSLIEKILQLKPKFAKIGNGKTLQEKQIYKDVAISNEKVEKALKYYLENLEEFLSPKFERKYVWMELANYINEPINKVFNKINYMKNLYNSDNIIEVQYLELMQEISAKEVLLKDLLITDYKPTTEGSLEDFWTDDEVEQLLTWYLTHLDKFKNPKYIRSYLWMEASEILNKSPLICSKKMSDIRTQYRNMVRESTEELKDWRFYNLCQKIYGTGKRSNAV